MPKRQNVCQRNTALSQRFVQWRIVENQIEASNRSVSILVGTLLPNVLTPLIVRLHRFSGNAWTESNAESLTQIEYT